MRVYGHRGARGLFPENTLEGIEAVVATGIDGIEIDVVVSGDKQLIVSHNPYAHYHICLDSSGNQLEKGEDNVKHRFYKMNYSQILSYDVGVKTHPEFLEQKKLKARIPLLADVFDSINAKVNTQFPLFLEGKFDQEMEGVLFPDLEDYALILKEFLDENEFNAQLVIKSFNINFMNTFYRLTGNRYKLGILVENNISVKDNLSQLDFVPLYYNPECKFVNIELINELHQRKIKLVTWTVNDPIEYQTLLDLDVDGVISDYPTTLINHNLCSE